MGNTNTETTSDFDVLPSPFLLRLIVVPYLALIMEQWVRFGHFSRSSWTIWDFVGIHYHLFINQPRGNVEMPSWGGWNANHVVKLASVIFSMLSCKCCPKPRMTNTFRFVCTLEFKPLNCLRTIEQAYMEVFARLTSAKLGGWWKTLFIFLQLTYEWWGICVGEVRHQMMKPVTLIFLSVKRLHLPERLELSTYWFTINPSDAYLSTGRGWWWWRWVGWGGERGLSQRGWSGSWLFLTQASQWNR